MTVDPLYPFLFLAVFSPGPNIILVTASGARFGFRRTLPHILGVLLGVALIAACAAGGVAQALLAAPGLRVVLAFISVGWMVYLAYGIWVSDPPSADLSARPMTFGQAVLFQCVNPKLWAVCLTAATAYPAGLPPMQEAFRLSLGITGINSFALTFWSFAGAVLSLLLQQPSAWRSFARGMSVALLLVALSVFTQ